MLTVLRQKSDGKNREQVRDAVRQLPSAGHSISDR